MKTKTILTLVGLGAALLLTATAAKKDEKPSFHQPDLKLDTTPVSEGKAPGLTSYADVLDNVRPAVVSVYSTKIEREQVPLILRQLYGPNVRGREQKTQGLGSGVIISADGYILTNNHVVEDADELKVSLNDGRELIAKVVGTDPKTDIAVIKIDADKLPALTIADSDRLRVGDVVFAIGNPLGVGQTVTMGIISATGRRVGILSEVGGYEDFIQTDAAINMGNSGGALVDARGRLVGINSAIISNNQGSIGIGFAIPLNIARAVMKSLIEVGYVPRGYLGVSTNPEPLNPELAESLNLPKDTKGVLVTDVTAKSAAAKAGIKQEDVITAINDKPVTTRDDLRLLVAQFAPGTKVTIKLFRDGKPQTVEVTLGKLDDNTIKEGEILPGLTVQLLNDNLRQQYEVEDGVQGLVVTEIKGDSEVANVFREGVVIEAINRVPTPNIAAAKAALRDGRNIAFVYYHGVQRYISFNLR
jgi:serine protease Do/serine protease DegQ